MANYFVIGNKFRPYTFEELSKPFEMYGQAYKEQEAALDTLGNIEPSSALPEGSVAQSMYSTASTSLREVSDRLATQGLNPTLRNDIKRVAKDYSRTMNTINTAQKALNEERARRAKLGEDYVYQDNDLSIDRFLSGETPNTKQTSLSGITKTVAADVSQLAQNLVSAPEFTKAKNSGGQYWQIAQDYGLDNADMIYLTSIDENGRYLWETDPSLSASDRAAFRNKYDAFIRAAENKRNEVEYDKYSAPEKQRIDAAINEGMYAALGQTKYSTQANRGYETPSQREAADRAKKLFEWQYTVEDGTIKGLKQPTVSTKTTSRTTRGGGAGDEIGAQTEGVRVSVGNNPEKNYKTLQEAFDVVESRGGGLTRRGRKKLNLSDNVVVTDLSDEGKIRALHNINVSTVGKTKQEINALIEMYRPELDTYLYYESTDENNPDNNVFISADRVVKTKMPGVADVTGINPTIVTIPISGEIQENVGGVNPNTRF